MPTKRFLPSPKQAQDYPIASGSGFIGYGWPLLGTIAETMNVGEPQTPPRRPTPFSNLWQFASDLEGKSGATLQTAARRRLRGILALLALCSREGLVVACKTSPPFDEQNQNIPLVDMLRHHISGKAESILQSSRLVYLTLNDQVVAGYSPATLFFPAANPLKFLPEICPLWFSQKDGQLGEWADPTNPARQISGRDFAIDQRLIPDYAGAIRVWLDGVIGWINQAASRDILPDPNLLKLEISIWRQELEKYPPVGVASNSSIPFSAAISPQIEGFLNAIKPISYGSEEPLPSGLTLHKGYYLLTKTLLGNTGTVLQGRITGSPEYAVLWDKVKSISGDHLGRALGINKPVGEALNIPFLFVDKLFTPTLARLSDSSFAPDHRWRALAACLT